MAHDQAKKREARTMYVYRNLAFADIERAIKIPAKTIMRWKRRAMEKEGDDWDKARHIASMSEQNVESINRQVYADWLTKFKEVQTTILGDDKMDTGAKIGALASLADSFNKMVAALRKIEPEVNLASTALKVLEIIADYLNGADVELAHKFGEHIDAIGVKIQTEFT